MRRKKLVTLISSVCLILVLASLPFMAACPAPAEEEPAEVITARFSGWAAPLSIPGQVEAHFFDLLHEKVGDRIQVEVFQGGTLYHYQEAQIPLKTGAVEIIDLSTFSMYEWVPGFKVAFLTGVWDVDELMTYLSSSDFEPVWDKLLEVSNCIPLGPHPAGTTLLWSTEPLSSTADFQGLRVESSSFEQVDIAKALGGSGGALQLYDIYTALQQGQYDAAVGTPSIALAFGWAEFVKYVGTEPWGNNINYFLVNKDFWDSLPSDIQEAFRETAEETTQWSLEMFAGAEAGQLAALEELWGIEYFTLSDWENVIEAARAEVWPDIRDEVGSKFFDAALRYAGLAD